MPIQTANQVIYPASFQGSVRDSRSHSIVLAARKIFLFHGFHAASMDDIAMEANVSKRTIYNRYASKDELFEDVAIDACHQLLNVDVKLCFKTPMEEFLLDVSERYLGICLNDQAVRLQRTISFQAARLPHLGKFFLDQTVYPFVSDMADYFEQQIALGRIKDVDPVDLGWTFRSLISEPLMTEIVSCGQLPTELDQRIHEQSVKAVRRFIRLFQPVDA